MILYPEHRLLYTQRCAARFIHDMSSDLTFSSTRFSMIAFEVAPFRTCCFFPFLFPIPFHCSLFPAYILIIILNHSHSTSFPSRPPYPHPLSYPILSVPPLPRAINQALRTVVIMVSLLLLLFQVVFPLYVCVRFLLISSQLFTSLSFNLFITISS